MPRRRRYGFTLMGLIGIVSAVAVLSSLLFTRLYPESPPSWYLHPQSAWVGEPIRLPPRTRALAERNGRGAIPRPRPLGVEARPLTEPQS